MSISPTALIIKSMDTPHTARLARRISAASMDSADRQLTRQALSALTR